MKTYFLFLVLSGLYGLILHASLPFGLAILAFFALMGTLFFSQEIILWTVQAKPLSVETEGNLYSAVEHANYKLGLQKTVQLYVYPSGQKHAMVLEQRGKISLVLSSELYYSSQMTEFKSLIFALMAQSRAGLAPIFTKQILMNVWIWFPFTLIQRVAWKLIPTTMMKEGFSLVLLFFLRPTSEFINSIAKPQMKIRAFQNIVDRFTKEKEEIYWYGTIFLPAKKDTSFQEILMADMFGKNTTLKYKLKKLIEDKTAELNEIVLTRDSRHA